MNQEHLKNSTDTYYRNLKKQAGRIIRNNDAEAIHQFRVEYKKLRAFLRMLSEFGGAKEKIIIGRDLKKVYRIAGSIRDLQLQEERLRSLVSEESKKLLAYFLLLRREISRLKPELIEQLARDPVGGSWKKTVAGLPALFPLNNFRRFVRQKLNTIYSHIHSARLSDENIHEIRKIIKDLFYNLEIYGGIELKILSVKIRQEKDELFFKKLLNELGHFQDMYMAISLLKPYWLALMPASTRLLLENIKQKWILEKAATKRLLVKKLKADLLPGKMTSR